jgi:hypothetical protein
MDQLLTFPPDSQLVELCILPLEFCLSKESYARLNRVLMTGLFFLPLCVSPPSLSFPR